VCKLNKKNQRINKRMNLRKLILEGQRKMMLKNNRRRKKNKYKRRGKRARTLKIRRRRNSLNRQIIMLIDG
jgi:hypothetical protein